MTDSRDTRDSSKDVRLVVADVDGTLLTPDKVLTPRARAAVHAVIKAGIAFTITSGRPPLGMTEEGFAPAMERFILRAPAA